MYPRLRKFALGLTLLQRFMLAGFFILLAGMAGIGAWVERQIETGVIHRTGATTALYVDSFVAPLLQDFGHTGELNPEQIDALGELIQNTPMGRQIVAIKIWDTRGRLLYSTDPTTIGRTYPMSEGLLRARLGQVVSEISPLEEEENAPLGARYEQLLETYAPVWLSGTDQIIAVAEFYQRTDELESEINVLQRRSWLVVGAAIFLMYLFLSGFVRRASDTIDRQQEELGRRVEQLTGLLAQNRELNDRVRRAAASVALLNESYLRRIGSELHDGPAQDLGLAILKFDSVARRITDRVGVDNDAANAGNAGARGDQGVIEQLSGIEAALQNALKEMRAIATGLGLPQLADLDVTETVVRVVRRHERLTGTQVGLELENLPEQAALPLKITLYRLIQEALNNAFRHAQGVGQRVRVSGLEDQLVVEVSDQGPGFQPEAASGPDGRLGLSGMRERVESLGGSFRIESEIGQGTRILATLPCQLEGETWEA